MRPLLILKTGSTLDGLCRRRGDFEDWILAGLAPDGEPVVTLDSRTAESLPDPRSLAGVVVTGSHAMVTEHLAWSERAAAWLLGLVEHGIPLLGICYGHQLLAYALGGEVGDNPRGREFGTVDIRILPPGRTDSLFGAVSSGARGHVSHRQAVLSLPRGATVLAATAKDPYAALVVGQRAWGVQFHPEFDADITRAYTLHTADALRDEGQDPDAIATACQDSPLGGQLLRRFTQIVREA